MRLRSGIAASLLLTTNATAMAAGAALDPFTETIVELRINGQHDASTLVVRRDNDGTLLLSARDFAALRLRTPARGAVMVNGERYYRMGGENDATTIFDEATQTVQMTLPVKAFLPTKTRLTAPDAPRLSNNSPGAFVNYDVSLQQGATGRQSGGMLELGAFGHFGVATGTMVARQETAGAQSVVRLDTTWTKDLPGRVATLHVGDAISTPGVWGRALRFGGVQYGTNFSTQPGLVKTPLLAAQGEAVVPSTVDVYINGQQVASEAVPPGPFTIDHLPALTGAGQLQVVVTDALGRQQVLSQPYYSGTALLRSGLNEFSVEAGSVRENYGYDSFSYGDVLGAATFRRGMSDTLTTGVHAEAQLHGSYALGGDAAWQAGTLGIVTAQLAAGGDAEAGGWLAGVGLERNGPRFAAYVQTQFTSATFSQLGASLLTTAPKQRTFGGVAVNLDAFGSLQVAYGLQSFHDARSVATLGLSYSLSMQRFGYLGLFATQTTADHSDSSLYLTWTMPVGERRTVSSGIQYSPSEANGSGGLVAVTNLQRSLPSGSGYGYNASLSTDDQQDLGLAYQGQAGLATLDYARRGDVDGMRLGAAGGVALTAAGIMPARRLDQSFAVVQVADYPGLTVFLDNQPVGRTDDQGRVLIDALRPYERNEISVDPTQVPMDGSLNQSAIDVTPAYRSGALVRFPVTRAYAATTRLVRGDGSPVPAGAVAKLRGGAEFPVALDGFLYVEGLSTTAVAHVAWQGGECSVQLRRPTGTDPAPDLGTLRCE